MPSVFDSIEAGPEIPTSTMSSSASYQAEVLDVDLDPTAPPVLTRVARPYAGMNPKLRTSVDLSVKLATLLMAVVLLPLTLVGSMVAAILFHAKTGYVAAPAWGQHVITASTSALLGALVTWLVLAGH